MQTIKKSSFNFSDIEFFDVPTTTRVLWGQAKTNWGETVSVTWENGTAKTNDEKFFILRELSARRKDWSTSLQNNPNGDIVLVSLPHPSKLPFRPMEIVMYKNTQKVVSKVTAEFIIQKPELGWKILYDLRQPPGGKHRKTKKISVEAHQISKINENTHN